MAKTSGIDSINSSSSIEMPSNSGDFGDIGGWMNEHRNGSSTPDIQTEKDELAEKIVSEKPDAVENNNSIFEAQNGMRFKLTTPGSENLIADWLKENLPSDGLQSAEIIPTTDSNKTPEPIILPASITTPTINNDIEIHVPSNKATITKGPNIVPQQFPHSENHPKIKSHGLSEKEVVEQRNTGFRVNTPLSANGQNFFANNFPDNEPVKEKVTDNNINSLATLKSFLDQTTLNPGESVPQIEPSREPEEPKETMTILQNPATPEEPEKKNDPTTEALHLIGQRITDIEAASKESKEDLSNQIAEIRDSLTQIAQRLEELGNQPAVTPAGTIPINIPLTPTQGPIPTQTSESEVIAQLQEELRNLKGQNTPEQKAKSLEDAMSSLLNGRNPSELSDEEKAQYLDLMLAKEQITNGIANTEKENKTKRERKEKIIKIVAFVAGAGLAIATPAVSVAAVVAVTLGGRFATPSIKKLENKIRTKATDLKSVDRNGKTLEQLGEIDKKIKRNEWWANRLGEVAAVVSGGTAGYGMGKLAQGIFNSFHAAQTVSQPNPTTQAPSPAETSTSTTPTTTMAPSPESLVHSGPLGSGTEGSLYNGNVFDTNGLGWERPLRLWLDGAGGPNGEMQGRFLAELQRLGVTRDMLTQPGAEKIFMENGINALYHNGDVLQTAQSIAQQLMQNIK